jgi:hypothetical protein
MSNNDFRNQSSQAERRAILRQDRDASTYHAQAKLSEQLDAARYKSTIVGNEESVRYPAASGPWSGPQPGPEEPLGVDLNAFEPVGTPSLSQISGSAPSGPLEPDVDDGVAPSAAPPRPTLRIRRMK